MFREDLLAQIDKGREGKNWGLSMNMPKFEQYVDGLAPETYTLLFSGSGVGKTSYALHTYIYQPIMANLDNLDILEIHYISLEMKPTILLAKLLSTYIFDTYKVEISYKHLLSKTRGTTLSDEEYNYVLQSMDWLAKVEKVLKITTPQLNARVFKTYLEDIAKANGKFSKNENGDIVYKPNNPDKIILIVTDHLALSTPASGNSLKIEMDNISKVAVFFRNLCLFSFLMIMQANREASNVERRKLELVEPQRNDIKDSSCMEADSDIIVAIFNPNREKLSTYRKYSITQLGNNFRSVLVLKCRYGEGDVAIGCNFFGRVNVWKELPKGDEIFDYEKYTNSDYLLNKYVKNEEDEETNLDAINNFNLTL